LSPSREHRGGDFLCVFKGFRVLPLSFPLPDRAKIAVRAS